MPLFLHLPRNTRLKPIAGPLKNQEAFGTHTRKKQVCPMNGET
jgi:hypothetical protein